MTASLTPLPGLAARLDNSFTLTQDGTFFFEWGAVTFGESGDKLTFTSIGPGYVLGQAASASTATRLGGESVS